MLCLLFFVTEKNWNGNGQSEQPTAKNISGIMDTQIEAGVAEQEYKKEE